MTGQLPDAPLRVIVYGGDVAALETALALREHCGDRCQTMLLTPVRDLPVRVQPAGSSSGEVARFDLAALAAEHGLGFRSDAVVAVDPIVREARTITGARICFDAMVVAFGVRPRASVPGAATCWGGGDPAALEGLLEDVRAGEARRIAFAVAPHELWTVPTYELALTAARRFREEGLEAELSVVTHEHAPGELLGEPAGEAIGARLARAGIELVARQEVASFQDGRLELRPGPGLDMDRVLAMAAVDGPRMGGLPRDAEGFLPVDEYGRVRGTTGIWAAGEVTSFPVREAGIAAQQARVVASAIAAEAGVGITPSPFRPTLRGSVDAASGRHEGSHHNGNGNGNGNGGAPLLWWPPEQLAGEHLGPHVGRKLALGAPATDRSIAVSVELGHDGRAVAAAPV
jgi:sulfide:quinone oxidoreductase